MRKRITKQNLAIVKQLDLLSYFTTYEPDVLIKTCFKDYTTSTHSSLHLSNGLWYWWKERIGGKSALDYFIKVEGWDFLTAANYLLDLIKNKKPIFVKQEVIKSNRFKHPTPNRNNDIVKKYLIEVRKINKDIVDYFINHYFIYEDACDHSVVFMGYDEHCIPRFASKRSTNSNIKKDVLGSSKEYSFSFSNDNSQSVHVFESAIDLLSYMTILKHDGENYLEGNYLSLSGVGGANFPALSSYLKRHNYIKSIHLHLDNDDAGIKATNEIIKQFRSKYYIYDERINNYKDINEYLTFK